MSALLDAVTSGITTVLGWIGEVITSLITPAGANTEAGALYALLPLVGVSIAISGIMLAIRVIKSFTWGA